MDVTNRGNADISDSLVTSLPNISNGNNDEPVITHMELEFVSSDVDLGKRSSDGDIVSPLSHEILYVNN